jgi:hypothetical protein
MSDKLFLFFIFGNFLTWRNIWFLTYSKDILMKKRPKLDNFGAKKRKKKKEKNI